MPAQRKHSIWRYDIYYIYILKSLFYLAHIYSLHSFNRLQSRVYTVEISRSISALTSKILLTVALFIAALGKILYGARLIGECFDLTVRKSLSFRSIKPKVMLLKITPQKMWVRNISPKQVTLTYVQMQIQIFRENLRRSFYSLKYQWDLTAK